MAVLTGVFILYWTGFFLGILHTIVPCEDKTIFAFLAFGTSKDNKAAFKVISIYGLGLIFANLIIGLFVTTAGNLIFDKIDVLIRNAIGAITIVITGFYILIRVIRNDYFPHSQQGDEITESFQNNKGRISKRTAFFLGMISGIPPCAMEFAIYNQALLSAPTDLLTANIMILLFGIGTYIGLFFLGTIGVIGSIARKKLDERRKVTAEQKNEDLIKKTKKKTNISKIEIMSAVILLIYGFILLLLAVFGVNIYPSV